MDFLSNIGTYVRLDELDRRTTTGASPLHIAADLGYEVQGEALIRKGANIRAYDLKGWTPLHYAVQAGHEGFANLLLAQGGKKICQPVTYSWWLILLSLVLFPTCVLVGFLCLINWMLYSAVGTFILVFFFGLLLAYMLDSRSPKIKKQPVVRWILIRTYSIWELLKGGEPVVPAETVLHVAARKDRRAIVHLLLDVGMPLSEKTEDGLTALDLAKRNGHSQMAQMLIEAGA